MTPADKPDETVNILLVDDQPGKLLSYEVMLEELGENLIKANSANEALEHLLKTDISVVLIDVCMPDLDGFELAAMIHDHPRFQQTAIIFVSAIFMSELDRLRGYELGAVDYVPVPVVPALLRAKVKVFAELHRKSRQLERLNGQLEQRVAERTGELERANAELERANAELERRVEERTRERELALAQVHEMQKLESLGQLTGGVAHDFNNLLMAVLGNLHLLHKRVPDEPRVKRLIDNAIEGAERGATLTKRMLAFARRQELMPESVDLRQLVDGMAEMLRHSLGPTIQIATDFRPGLAPVRVDRNQLELALLNLALNGRDAMPLGGRLVISARVQTLASANPEGLPPGNFMAISVTDMGSGMDEATLKRATEPFFTTKGVGKGTGLGLSMVHGFVVQSGGRLQITSRRGAGTTVEMLLPAAEHMAAAEPTRRPPPPPARSGPPRRVLIVDDDPLVAAGTVALLEDLGHTVIEAPSGKRALDLLRNGPPVDLVITDHAMPEMTGTELAREIARSWPDLPVVLATGYADLPNGENPGLPRLSKPYRPDDLVTAIDMLVGNRPAHNVIPIELGRSALR